VEQQSVFVEEINVRNLGPPLDLAEARLGTRAVADFLEPYHVQIADLRKQTNWVSLRFAEDLCEWIAAQVGADQMLSYTAKEALSPKSLGFLYPIIRTLGSPKIGYESLAQFSSSLNKVYQIKTLESRRRYALIEYRPARPELRGRLQLICQVLKAQILAGPTLWGLPEARLVEKECMFHGGQRCLYEVRWADRAGWWAAAAGAGLGVLAGLAGGGGVWLLVAPLIGLLAGQVWGDRRQKKELTRFNAEQNAGLQEAAREAERRFVELTEAKAAVDRKVEERTAELEAASVQLSLSLERMKELGKVKDEFLANVSHELRTPLTLILAPLEQMLAGPTDPAVARDNLKAMYRSAVRLHGMVNDLLELARHEAGHLRLRMSEGDLHELGGSVVESFRSLAETRQIALRFEPVDHQPLTAWADFGRMEFVLNNLLSNAMKFTPAGGEIVVRTARVDQTMSLEVADNGPGIPAALQARVFERFERFAPPSAPGTAGAGIGLTLVKAIVELHGGTVALQSEEGHGTRVRVTLKRGRDHLADGVLDRHGEDVPVPFGRRGNDVELLALAGPTPAEHADAPRAGPDAPCLLVVEDNDDLRAFLVRTLGSQYRIIEARDGQAGLELATTERPQLVLSDVMMPRLDGYEMCRRLKASLETRSIPVILITAKNDTERVLEGFESGADDYLIKPFNTLELLARIEVHLRLRRLMDEQVQREKLVVLGTLAAGMAHEVRNPASAILAGLPKVARELEREKGLDAGVVVMVRTAIECAERINRLVGDLLDLGQPHRDGPQLWDPHEGLSAALRLLSHKASPKVQIRQKLEFQGQIEVLPAAINQIFLNLVDNALLAVGDAGTIDLTTSLKDGGFLFTVKDTGPGIAPATLTRMFNPFFSTRAPGHGTGLGLYISRRIATDHGGRLEVESTLGQGTRFSLWLPCPRGVHAAERNADEARP
jgi:signal transduction histidine kinase